jgi:hypothetical protein
MATNNLQELDIVKKMDEETSDQKTLELIVGMLKHKTEFMSFRFYVSGVRYEMRYVSVTKEYVITESPKI